MHSVNYLYPLTQTIYRMLQIVAKEHNSRVNEAGIFLILLHEVLRHVNFPFQQPANHLYKKDKAKFC